MERGVTDSRITDCRIENIGVGAEYGGGIRLAWGCVRNQVLRQHDSQDRPRRHLRRPLGRAGDPPQPGQRFRAAKVWGSKFGAAARGR